MHSSSASPRGGPRADVGEYGDFMRTLQQISSLVVGEMWGPTLGENRGLNLEEIGDDVCSLYRWQDGGGEQEGMF